MLNLGLKYIKNGFQLSTFHTVLRHRQIEKNLPRALHNFERKIFDNIIHILGVLSQLLS